MDGFEKDQRLLLDLVEHTGLDGTKIARRIGVSPSTIGRPLSGAATTRLSMRTVEKLCSEFPDFPGWKGFLDSLSESVVQKRLGRSVSLQPPPPAAMEKQDSLAIPMLELGYGMGGTFLDGIDPGEVIEHFPRAFVRMFTKAPEQLLCFSHGIGDSMYPTIGDRDVLLIDRSRDTISVNDQIWVLSVGGIGMVKRVRMGGGKITLLSDNENVPDYDPGDDELQIIGRVVAVVRRI